MQISKIRHDKDCKIAHGRPHAQNDKINIAPFHAMATLADLQAELAEVKSALRNVRMAGQSSGFGGRNTTRANYNALLEDKNDLERRIARLDGSRPLIVSGRVTGLGCQVGS
jgi:hypothetical protein